MVRFCFVFLFFSPLIWGQKSEINTCFGAVDISDVSEINVAFKGFKGAEKSTSSSFFDKEVSKNNVWFVYEANENGSLKLNCRIYLDSFDFMVLKTSINTPCLDIEGNKAAPILIKPNTTCTELNNAIINVESGFAYSIVFFSLDKDQSNISFLIPYL